jgi:anti-sigma factor ChrR (cupin superfamily)
MKMYNIDFSKRVVIDTNKEEWIQSPANGVQRIPLERQEAESGHTTSIVEYLPGTSFDKHFHPMGEEIFVLEGTFSDENGDYKAGTYIRNPKGTSHAPFSKEGCRILVKLNQMNSSDLNHLVIDTNNENWVKGHGNLEVLPLHSFMTEGVALVKWPVGEKFIKHTHFGGEEVFVLKGEFIDEFGKYPKGTWIRSPHLSSHLPYVEEETIILVKTGHLAPVE